jgi:1-acyl-sn-glycerol-3-phosphate acyltransferase
MTSGSPRNTARVRDVGASLVLSLRNVYETLRISTPTVVEALVGRLTKEICDKRIESWSRACIQNARIELEVVGREHMAPEQTYVVMSNHQSLYDIPVLFVVIGANVRMVAKTELFRVPIFGKALAVGGFVEVDRSNRARAIASLERARSVLASGTHVWIAPEGTRSRTGKLLPFKQGGFHLAMQARAPILPVSLRGTRDALPAKGVRSTSGAHVKVTIHAPIDSRRYTGKRGRHKLMADVRASIESGLVPPSQGY